MIIDINKSSGGKRNNSLADSNETKYLKLCVRIIANERTKRVQLD